MFLYNEKMTILENIINLFFYWRLLKNIILLNLKKNKSTYFSQIFKQLFGFICCLSQLVRFMYCLFQVGLNTQK